MCYGLIDNPPVAAAGEARHRREGAVALLSAADLSTLHEIQDSRDYVTDLKFSGDGALLALASQDTKVYVYNVRDSAGAAPLPGARAPVIAAIKLRSKCEMHNAPLSRVDFSADGEFLQSNDTALELMYYKTADGQQVMHPSEMKNHDWASHTCPLTWAVTAAHLPAKSRIETTCVCRSFARDLVAVGDEAGQVRLHRYPAIHKGEVYHAGTGHCGAVRCVAFAADGGHVLSVGGDDRCVMQWKLVVPERGVPAAMAPIE